MPKYYTYFTTGTGLPFRKSCWSGWALQSLQKIYAYSFWGRKFKAIGVSPIM